jgi:diacylglycerol kinase (ATP)
MKALVILNPPAADAERQALRDALRRHFTAGRIEYEVYETRKGDRTAEVVRRRLRAGFDLVVAAGGDGTVSAVSDGLVGSSIPLGIVPTGTGNLIAHELGIPNDVAAAIALIAGSPRARKIDAMRIGQRTFVLNASVGISASIVGGTTRRSKSRFGRIAYVGTGFFKVLSSRPQRLVVEVDKTSHPYRAVEVSVMNCGLLARRLYPSGPDIRIDDGHLGVWILSMKTAWDCLRYAIGLATGRTGNSDAQFISARKTVSIRSGVPLPVQADGDIIGTTPVDVAVLPGALTVLVSGTSTNEEQSVSP